MMEMATISLSSTIMISVVVGSAMVGGMIYLMFGRLRRLKKWGILHVDPWPIFGNMGPALFRRCSITDVITRAYELSSEAAYVGLYDFSEPIIVIRSPNLIKDIAVKYFEHFVDHRGFVDVKQDPLFGKNLFSLRGDKWKEVRSVLSPSFTSSKMKGMFKLMWECADNFSIYFEEHRETVLDVKEAFTRYTNDVIASCAFGISIDSMKHPNNDFYLLGRKTTKMEGWLTVKFFLLSGFPRLSKWLRISLIDPIAATFFESIIRDTIEKRDRDSITRPDMIQLMMETRRQESSQSPLTVQDMAAQAFGFFFAGFDSSSAFMSFLAHELAVNEDIQTRLQNEIDQVLEQAKATAAAAPHATNNDDDDHLNITYEAINKMLYLDAVIREGLRKYPGAPFLDRRCNKPFELPPATPGAKPFLVKPGTTVWFPVFAIHRDPKYYPDPDKFDPQRFINEPAAAAASSPPINSQINPFTYFPFGQGPRMCIGYRFALLESKIIFFNLLARCNLRKCSKTNVPIKISKGSFGLAAEGGYWLQIEKRNK